MDSPCCHNCDFTDVSDLPEQDTGCCTPLPVRIECGAPVLPTPDCDEQDPIVEYDPDTEEFTVLSTMYDQNCSALTDSTGSPLLSLIA